MSHSPDIVNNSTLFVDPAALRGNVRAAAASLCRGCRVVPVLKCDAYGLGMIPAARALEGMEEVYALAVAHIAEGIELRRAGIQKDILVLGNPNPRQLREAAEHALTLTVGRSGLLPALAAPGKPVSVQIKLDTGLHRAGVAPGEELAALLREWKDAGDTLRLTGAYSHFADTANAARCREQYESYLAGVEQIEAAGLSVPFRHICDSAASELYPEYHLDAVRLGRRLMMDHPTAPRGDIREIASWRAVITDIRSRRAGDTLGYADAYRLPRDARIAILGIGYGDGLPPAMAAVHAPVLIGGVPCPLLGCCMDQCFADVTEAKAEIGGTATIFGYDEAGNLLSAQKQAERCGAAEGCGITSALSPRVTRLWLDDSREDGETT